MIGISEMKIPHGFVCWLMSSDEKGSKLNLHIKVSILDYSFPKRNTSQISLICLLIRDNVRIIFLHKYKFVFPTIAIITEQVIDPVCLTRKK